MRRRYDFLVVGDLCLDIDIWPGRRVKQVEIKDYTITPAGSAGNTALALRAIDKSALIALAYPSSKDHVDKILRAMLRDSGIELISVRGKGGGCLVMNIITAKGYRRAYTSKGPKIEEVSKFFDIASASIIHIAGYLLELLPIDRFAEKLSLIKGSSVVSIDLFPRVSEIRWESLSKVLRTADIVLGNIYEIRSITGSIEKSVEKILSIGVDAVIVKKGSKGATLYRKTHEKISCTPGKVKPVILKGAGDVFNASFIDSIYRGSTYQEALEKACKNASEHVVGEGPLHKILRRLGLLQPKALSS
ncbi:MAG: carbohydrate kinase family protein [Sulfolobales archaeon]